jgi:hypothetical protein
VLFACIKVPFRVLFTELDCLWGFNILCGIYALISSFVITNLKNKNFPHSLCRCLFIVCFATLISYTTLHYGGDFLHYCALAFI